MENIAKRRCDDYVQAVNKVHSIDDGIGVEIVAATQVIAPGSLPVIGPPIILETDYFSLIDGKNIDDIWFDIWGGMLAPGSFGAYSLPYVRRTRPRYDNTIVEKLLGILQAKSFPFVFVEPEYITPRNRPHQFSELYPLLIDQCVRLRVPMPRAKLPSRVDSTQLIEIKKRLMDNQIRHAQAHPNATTEPTYLSNSTFLHRAELLFLASGKVRDWNVFLTNLNKLDASLKWLLDDREFDSEKHALRLAHDLIPTYTYRLLKCGVRGFRTWEFSGGGGVHSPWRNEMMRLKEGGFIEFKRAGQQWYVTERGKEVLDTSGEGVL